MGLVTAVTCLQRRAVCPNINLRVANPMVIDGIIRGVAVAFPSSAMSCIAGALGSVSSFGFQGSIAHAVLRCDGAAAQPPAGIGHGYRRRVFGWVNSPHPLAQRRIQSSDNATRFRSPAAGALLSVVADHVVQDRVIFPGMGYLEAARAVAPAKAALHSIYFLMPLFVEEPGLLIECSAREGRFEMRSGVDDAFVDATTHCSGSISAGEGFGRVQHSSLRVSACQHVGDVSALYNAFFSAGLQYGPGYRTLVQAWGGKSDVFGRLRVRPFKEGMQVHPADLDDAMCLGGFITSGDSSGDSSETRVPFAVDDAMLQGARGELWAVRRREKTIDLRVVN